MSQYKVRSRDLVDLVNDINGDALILSPFFQRKLVWRRAHQVDFIKTILLGYPFPEIFISRGTLDVETRKSVSCIVDGQQRMNAIREFINNEFDVDGKLYSDLTQSEKEQFLKYEIAIIDLDLAQEDPQIIEIFTRLNRTFYALSTIEKYSTEYGSSEFMLVAKMLCGELQDEGLPAHNVAPDLVSKDPNIAKDFVAWANEKQISEFRQLLLDSPIFTKYEIARQVHLMFTLNLMATFLVGIYGRNEQVVPHLETYSNGFDLRDELIERLERTAKTVNRLKLPRTSDWFSKSNIFSLVVAIDANYDDVPVRLGRDARQKFIDFLEQVPEDYALAGREAVNNKRERRLRNAYVAGIIASL